ncbi:MAG TPA: acyl carrier protein [Verrucomicrobiota bacterium]|jgi:acyl carrier protein|nr:acyl carrier protein [Verrucomicrobiota bacterium]HRT10702.1 acyl carrier protein [Candidatus Paceibacterota bacterium]
MTDTLTTQERTRVEDILVDVLDVTREQLTPEAKIQADLGADSLDIVDIALKVEESFGVTLPEENLERIVTVEDLCDALAATLGRE